MPVFTQSIDAGHVKQYAHHLSLQKPLVYLGICPDANLKRLSTLRILLVHILDFLQLHCINCPGDFSLGFMLITLATSGFLQYPQKADSSVIYFSNISHSVNRMLYLAFLKLVSFILRRINTIMNKTKRVKSSTSTAPPPNKFHIEFMNTSQQLAYAAYQQHDVLFLTGPAGTAKTHLSMAFAIYEILQRTKKKIVLTRPVVEAGESLGYLPGDLEAKVNPYLMPLVDCMGRMIGEGTPQREIINRVIEIAPLAYMRGRTFNDAVCILDEAQNASKKQIKLFLTRMGKNTKMIVNGDIKQSDLRDVELIDVIARLESVQGLAVVKFGSDSIVRHPMVAAILERLEE